MISALSRRRVPGKISRTQSDEAGNYRQGDTIAFELRANAFLHHMVRNIIGCLIYVGKRKYPPEWIGELLKSGKRSDAAPTFSAAGLYLAGITYDAKWKLPSFVEPPLAAVLPRTEQVRRIVLAVCDSG